MSKENCRNVSSCKQSFKAVENFLRRIAFNLGNTQSRTEVKIISCIPIDVTDLQQKIFQLQKELADVQATKPTNVCSCAKRCEVPQKQVLCNECLLGKSSLLSVFCPPACCGTNLRTTDSVRPNACLNRDDQSDKTENTARSRSCFRKKKKCHRKKTKSRLVYCAQTKTNSPFYPFSKKLSVAGDVAPMRAKASNKCEDLDRSYLADVIRRQYQHQPLVTEFSNFSDISAPVCRDHVSTFSASAPCAESDMCSCVHSTFHNVDNYMHQTAERYYDNAYYDSTYYDLVPVKEKKMKHKNDIDKHRGKEPMKQVIKCWPERTRPKHRTKPMVVNYCTMSPLQEERPKFSASSPRSHHVPMDRTLTRHLVASLPRRRTDLELGPIYTKPVRKHKKDSVTIASRHNVATESPSKDMAPRQRATTAATITDPPEDKTEMTLKLIKTMLQSVLAEVKTNNNSTDGQSSVQTKKDAVVQNGPSLGYEYGASQLLQSYTYSPYNMAPFMPSCSHKMSCSNYVCPEFQGVQGLPFQQYPLLIQPQKHLCNNYKSKIYNKPATKYAASAATNTEQAQERSKETEQLIKEIYKSIALNMEESSKDNSIQAYTKPKALVNNYTDLCKTDSDKDSRSIAQAISEIFRNTHPRESTVTRTTDSTLNSYLNPSKPSKTVPENVVKRDRSDKINVQTEDSTKNTCKKDKLTERMSTHHETEEQSEDSEGTVVEDTDQSTTDVETPNVRQVKKKPPKTPEPEKEKSGLFKKMFKIFQPRRRKRSADDLDHESEKETESDSDDYQTVYSHKVVDASTKPKKSIVRSRPHSKVFDSKQPQKRRSRTRSPEKHSKTPSYMERMEQEYRRVWDEKLMFHENQRPRHSEDPSRQPSDRAQRHRHAYYQTYEARPVLVETKRHALYNTPGSILRSRHMSGRNHSSHTRHTENVITHRHHPTWNNSLNTTTMKNMNVGSSRPYFVTSKGTGSAGTRKTMFSKGWRKYCKPQCVQQFKELIING